MTLEQKVGQLLLLGFNGTQIDQGLKDTLQLLKPGGIVVFGRNIKTAMQTARLNFDAQLVAKKSAGVPLLISVDQEGGPVARIKTVKPLPSARALGQSDDRHLAQRAGLLTGNLLRTLGFTMNLAPVLDIGEKDEQTFIGVRAYSPDPKVVADMGLGFAAGLREAHILPTAKHFPGHGGKIVDSHLSLSINGENLSNLLQKDIFPFVDYSKSANSAVMMAHVAYPHLDSENVPATYSKKIVTDLLRSKLGFRGLVISDDIEMGGAQVGRTVGERAVRAIAAGVDMVMLAWNRAAQWQARNALLQAVRSGQLPISRIDQSVRRILETKKDFVSTNTPFPNVAQLDASLRNKDLQTLSDQVSWQVYQKEKPKLEKSVGLFVRNNGAPLRRLRFISGHSQILRSLTQMKTHLNLSGEPFYRVNLSQTMQWLSSDKGNGLVIIVSGVRTARMVQQLSEAVRKQVIVINAEMLSAHRNRSDYMAVVDMWTYHPNIAEWLIKSIEAAQSLALRRPATY